MPRPSLCQQKLHISSWGSVLLDAHSNSSLYTKKSFTWFHLGLFISSIPFCESLSYLNYNSWLRMQAVDQRKLLGISIEPVRSTVGLIGPHWQTRVVQIPKVLSDVFKLASVYPYLLLWLTFSFYIHDATIFFSKKIENFFRPLLHHIAWRNLVCTPNSSCDKLKSK